MASDSASTTGSASATATVTATATTATTSTASRRQSCDRCHGQKLRCTRASGSNTGACNRCLRQNAQCVYSFSLPKGRPSMYRLHMANSSSSSSRASSVSNLAAAAAASTSTAATSTSAAASAGSSCAGAGAAPAPATGQSQGSTSTSPATPEPLPSNRSDSLEEADVSGTKVSAAAAAAAAAASAPMDTDAASTDAASESMSIWSWLAEPFNWGDMHIEMDVDADQQLQHQHQAMMDGIHQLSDAAMASFPDAAFPHLPASWGTNAMETHNGTASSLSSSSSSTHLYMPPEQMHHHHPQQQQHHQHQQHQHQQQQPQMHLLGPDAGIAQLSQLSMRLYPLHRTCCSLAETVESLIQSRDFSHSHILPNLLVDNSTFSAVAQWLVHISADSSNLFLRTEASQNQTPTPNATAASVTLGDTLLDAFSASCHLLEIMRCLQLDSGFWANGTNPLPTPTSMTGSLDGSTAYLDLDPAACNGMAPSSSSSLSSSSSSSPPNFARAPNQHQYSNTVMRHLVIACHTLLLNIFVAVLTALQHDGDLRSSSPSASVTPSGNGAVDSDPRPDAGLADIRLVMIVQLCSYLTERQCRAVHTYLSPPPSASPSQQPSSQQLFDIPQHQAVVGLPASLPTTQHTSAEVVELEMEVRHRIARLRQTLFI